MVTIQGDDELNSKHICFTCVGDPYLSADIEKTGAEHECSYCGDFARTWIIEDLADRVELAFEQHYVRTSDQPNSLQERWLADKESSYEWSRPGEPVVDAIENAASIPQSAAEDIVEILSNRFDDFDSAAIGEETEFSADSHYEEKDTDTTGWQDEWRSFEQSLKTEARFFSRTASSHLASIFGGIDKLRATNGRQLIIEIGPGRKLSRLYRARTFQADEKLEEALARPDLHLGAPPARLASAGRMNARGISVFYGATKAPTAIAEVRPPVGSKVAVAKFDIVRPLRVLDLTVLEKVEDYGSVFDPSLKDRLERVAFLRSMGRRMSRPVMPNDEAFEYLVTQAIADFLATENAPVVDGIIYRSVQIRGGRNIVLFHKAARVEEMDLPEGTKVEASSGYGTEDGWETEYLVYEEVPPSIASPMIDDHHPLDFPIWLMTAVPAGGESREATLRVDPNTVEVHWVESVAFRSTKNKVRRHRFEKQQVPF